MKEKKTFKAIRSDAGAEKKPAAKLTEIIRKKNSPEQQQKPQKQGKTQKQPKQKQQKQPKQEREQKIPALKAQKAQAAKPQKPMKAQKTAAFSAEEVISPKKKKSALPKKEIRRRIETAEQTQATGTTTVKIIPLGGVDGIGMNMTAFECGNDIIVVDCGIAFPGEDMPGVEVVTPDFTYLQKNEDKLRGLILTHGHEDHIGSVPFFLKKVKCDVYATRLTLGILQYKLEEHQIRTDDLYEVRAGEVVTLGNFDVEFIHVNHSMPDSVALCIGTPVGRIVHTGDFKVDYTPVGTTPIDLARFAELGRKGVRLLLCDSTNAERPGYTPSENILTASFDRIFSETNKRVVIATFSSNVHRIQQVLEASEKWGRKVAVTGRSMQNVLKAARDLGYISIPEGLVVDLAECKLFPPEKLTILTTGSQGEPMSALYRMAFGEHSLVTLGPSDLVVLSASCIPGNEKTVTKIINELCKRSVDVITDRTDDVHVSGHACREELKLIHSLVRPDCFVPVHGEYKHLVVHARLAKELGMPADKVLIPEAGKVIELDRRGIHPAGTVEAGKVMIDSGFGDGVESAVLRDRTVLSENGVVFVTVTIDRGYGIAAGPELATKGFVYVKDSEELMDYLREAARKFTQNAIDRGLADPVSVGTRLKEDLTNAIYQKTHRKPVVVTVVNYIE